MDASFSAVPSSLVAGSQITNGKGPNGTQKHGHRGPAERAASKGARPPTKRDLLILRAIVSFPWATDSELGRTLGLPRATVTRSRLRMRDKGLLGARYAFDLDRMHPEPIAVVCGRAGPDVSDKELSKGLERLLKERGSSGAFLVEGGSFAGALTNWPHGHLPLWVAAALGLRAAHGGGYLVQSLDAFPFPSADSVRRSVVDFRPFLETITGNARLPGAPPTRKSMRPRVPRAMRKSEVAVARSLMATPGLPIAEAAAGVGLSRSTFAHVKGALLERGYMREAGWVNLPALGYPVLLVVGLYRRPRHADRPRMEVVDILSRATAPVTIYASPAHEVTVTPYPDLVAARNVLREISAHERELELLAPPFAAPMLLTQAHLVSHSQPGDLMAAWLKP